LEKIGIAKCFKLVVTALDACRPKPSPDGLIECARKLAINTCACIFVGDSIADIRAGKAARTKTVAVLSGLFSREELEKEKPDLILENVNKLPDFLDSLLEQVSQCS
jgi:phosphoglycolate phosphatase-like HAD superfamily hydrolase